MILCILIVFTSLYYYIISLYLVISHYTVVSPVKENIRIVQITDLHNAEFGESNEKLVNMIREQSPDIICMTGDMLNRDDENTDIVVNLISELSEIAPVYFGYGNHETTWEEHFQQNLHDIFSDAGAIVLDNEYLDVDIKGTTIRIGGYMGYYWQPYMMTKDSDEQDKESSSKSFRIQIIIKSC